MTQLIKTKQFGEIEFEKTWAVAGGAHVGRLTKGGYCHFSGHPILSRAELEAAIREETDLKMALEWFDNRDKVTEIPGKNILIATDGEPRFEDGSPIESVADIINYMKPGPFQDAALRWWAKKSEEREKLAAHPEAAKMSRTVAAAEEVLSQNED